MLFTYAGSGDTERKPFVAFEFQEDTLEEARTASACLAFAANPCRICSRGHGQSRLLCLGDPNFCFELKSFEPEVVLGKDVYCDVIVTDSHVGSRHLRIRSIKGDCFILEQLSEQGCFLNECFLEKGSSEELRHGDMITLCKIIGNFRPLPVYVFHSEGGVDQVIKEEILPSCKNPETVPCKVANVPRPLVTPKRQSSGESLTMTVAVADPEAAALPESWRAARDLLENSAADGDVVM